MRNYKKHSLARNRTTFPSTSLQADGLVVWIGRDAATTIRTLLHIQDDQLYMAGCLWYLVKRDLSSARYSTSVHWTSHFLQGTTHSHVCLVTMYLKAAMSLGKP